MKSRNNMEKLKINIEKGLPIVQEMIKTVAITNEMGKSTGWIYFKQRHYVMNGKVQGFTETDVTAINNAVTTIGERIKGMIINYHTDREEVIKQVRVLANIVRMAYIYKNRMDKKKVWYDNRMKRTPENGMVNSFSQDDVFHINLAVMEIANKLLGMEFTL